MGDAVEEKGERRHHPRILPAHLPWFSGARLLPATRVTLLDLSASGALIESAVRVLPGRRAVLQCLGFRRPLVCEGVLVRVWVAALDDRSVQYPAAIQFHERLHPDFATEARSG